MRLFTALDLPDALRDACATYADRLRDAFDETEMSVRWSDPDTYHTTIRFIGECSEDDAKTYEKALDEDLVGTTIPGKSGVELKPFGVSVLPTRLSPHVIMVGLEQTPSLVALYKAVTTSLETAGLADAETSFRPHITLGRFGDTPDPEDVHHTLRGVEAIDLPDATVPHLTLFKSEQTGDGVRHVGLRQFDLTG
jgi:2'-5' RNA ligase